MTDSGAEGEITSKKEGNVLHFRHPRKKWSDTAQKKVE